MVTIIDYGMGNLRSVQKAFERVGVNATVTANPNDLAGCAHLVLPGVGAFRDAIAELKRLGFVDPIREHIAKDLPFLGICLGLQLLFDISHEDGEWPGLGIIPGEVCRFPDFTAQGRADLKVPHMGWNRLKMAAPSPLFNHFPADPSVYFVHSYFVVPRDESVISTRTDHGVEFVSSVRRGRLFATQFHPEKSQTLGVELLRNFSKT